MVRYLAGITEAMTERSTVESAEFDRQMEAYFEKHLPLPLRRPWVESALRKLMAVDELRAGLDGMTGLTGFEAVDAIIERAGLSVSYENCERIPPRGRLLVVANHPAGAADVFLMLQCLRRAREDVRVVINKLGPLLVPHITELCLAVDRYSRFDADARTRISAALRQEQVVILFPAGGISKPTLRGIRDHPWKHGAVHFVRDCQANVLPVHISGRSSLLFLSLPRKLRQALVAREMVHPVAQHITVRVGQPVPYGKLADGDVEALTRQLREAVYALARPRTPA